MLKDERIRARGTDVTDRLGKELKLNKKSINLEVRGIFKCHYGKNCLGVIIWNDNVPVTVISKIHADLPVTTVKCWDSSPRNHIKIDLPHYITKYNKYIGRNDFLDALVSVYWIDVCGKKWY